MPMNYAALIAIAARELAAGDVARAAARYEMALAAEPKGGGALLGLGHCRGRLGRRDEAISLLVRAGSAVGRDAGALCDAALELQRVHAHRESLTLLDRALRAAPTLARAHHLRALALERTGEIDEACKAAGRAHALAPRESNAAILLATLHARRRRFDEARALLAPLAADAADPNCGRATFELGRVLDRLDECDAAFECFAAAGRIALATPPVASFDPDGLERELATERALCTSAWFARWKVAETTGRAPVFVIGFYRSGTTLLETLLGAHSRIAIAGETDLIPDLLRELARLAPTAGHWTARLEMIGAAGAARLRKRFLQRAALLEPRTPEAAVFIDKTALNTLNAGFIRALFPEARFVIVLRDPRDVVLSCFMQAFTPTPLTAHFLDWEHAARCYDAVLGHWQHLGSALGFMAVELRYEALVADPRAALEPVLAAIGLDWEDGMVRAHETVARRAIITPSFVDVARPVYGAAVGRWRRYARQLERIEPWLAPHLARLGYR
jgi:tetratricopeptide (TPR) repeat protein